jgi:hypothetical protein
VTSYEDLFPILTMIALLSGDGLSSDGARFATDMRNKYFTVLVRLTKGAIILNKCNFEKMSLEQMSFRLLLTFMKDIKTMVIRNKKAL